MPMHYPPLADGTFRYGDAPRPLPSPVPGPEPGAGPDPGTGPATGMPAAGPAAGPAPEPPGSTKRSRTGVLTATVLGGLAVVVVVLTGGYLLGPLLGSYSGTTDPRGPLPGFGSGSSSDPGTGSDRPTRPFRVPGTFTVTSSPGTPVSGDDVSCSMPPSLSDIGEGTDITLRTPGVGVIADDRLVYEGGDLASCTFTFSFDDVPPGKMRYFVELPGRGQLDYTERELLEGVDITLGQ